VLNTNNPITKEKMQIKLEDTDWVIRSSKLKKGREYKYQRKRTKKQ
jgi:membrane protein implicated in regulation of membrane protease activity